MIVIQYVTESGSTYTADVVHQRIKKVDGFDWMQYKELQHGEVGKSLVIIWNDKEVTQTTPIVKLSFPKTKT